MSRQRIKQFIWLLVCLPLLCFSPLSYSSTYLDNKLSEAKYDLAFRKYSNLYMPNVDWKILKAQCFQESLFDETAVSHVGAQGICQFMPGTWREQAQKLGIMASPFNATLNIQVAASYMAQLRAGWTAPRPDWDRHSLAMASYNAGFGNILNAQKACGNQNLYNEIIYCLPCITGRHANETITYVERIWAFYERIRDKYRWL